MGSYGGFSNDDIRIKKEAKKAGRWFVIISFLIVLVSAFIIGSDGSDNSSIMFGASDTDKGFSITTGNDITIDQGTEFNFSILIHNSGENAITVTSVEFNDVIRDNISIFASKPVQKNSLEDSILKYSLIIPPYDFVSIDLLMSPTLHGKHYGEIEVCLSDSKCSSQEILITVTNGIISGEE
ncbi:MAG: hypothetical protein JEZ00_20840 [Anaerolineaceae bacterium]|nr:hypothetical protein [Anaerolineaceae bacterium]